MILSHGFRRVLALLPALCFLSWCASPATAQSIFVRLLGRDQSAGQINATLPPGITPGQWFVSLQSGCVLGSQSVLVTVN